MRLAIVAVLAGAAHADPPPRTFGGEDLTGETTAGVAITAGRSTQASGQLARDAQLGDSEGTFQALVIEPSVQVRLSDELDAFARAPIVLDRVENPAFGENHQGVSPWTLGLRERFAIDPCWTAALTASATLQLPHQTRYQAEEALRAGMFFEDDLRVNGFVAGRLGGDVAWRHGLLAAQAHAELAVGGIEELHIVSMRGAAAAGVARDGLAILAEVSTRLFDRFATEFGSAIDVRYRGAEPPDLGVTLRFDRGRVRSALHVMLPLEGDDALAIGLQALFAL